MLEPCEKHSKTAVFTGKIEIQTTIKQSIKNKDFPNFQIKLSQSLRRKESVNRLLTSF